MCVHMCVMYICAYVYRCHRTTCHPPCFLKQGLTDLDLTKYAVMMDQESICLCYPSTGIIRMWLVSRLKKKMWVLGMRIRFLANTVNCWAIFPASSYFCLFVCCYCFSVFEAFFSCNSGWFRTLYSWEWSWISDLYAFVSQVLGSHIIIPGLRGAEDKIEVFVYAGQTPC